MVEEFQQKAGEASKTFQKEVRTEPNRHSHSVKKEHLSADVVSVTRVATAAVVDVVRVYASQLEKEMAKEASKGSTTAARSKIDPTKKV